MTALRTALALDAHMTVLTAHGLFDLLTPYFATQRDLSSRIRLARYTGGHMFYMTDPERASLRNDALTLYQAH